MAVIASLSLPLAAVADGELRTFPSGWLKITTNKIVLLSFPRIQWQIVPSSVDEQVELSSGGGFSILRDTLMNVRVLGVSLPGASNPNAPNAPQMEVRMQVNGGGYQPIFTDSRQEATPDVVTASRNLTSQQKVDFGARYRDAEGNWSDLITSTNSNQHVVALKNGDSLPASAASTPRKFLTPYLDLAGKVLIGPNDLLLLIEATAGGPDELGFDQQDVAVLVTFSDVFPQ